MSMNTYLKKSILTSQNFKTRQCRQEENMVLLRDTPARWSKLYVIFGSIHAGMHQSLNSFQLEC